MTVETCKMEHGNTNKDMFESFYKNSLAKRLLDSRRILEDAEREIIKKLKEECGFQFTQRLEVMFKDIKMSEQRMQEFKKSPSHSMISIDFNVKVLVNATFIYAYRVKNHDYEQCVCVLEKIILLCHFIA